ncbi:MAG: PDZ domain-containing protein, partial [Bacteroidetes bacterium]|nr:PDZ domain-containing protein [Bacteroidota bacterium]
SNIKITLDYNYKFTFKPTYKIHNITAGSPAYEAGLQKGDVVIKINGKYTYDLKLEEIVSKFYQKENTRIELVVERGGIDYQYNFRLRDVLSEKSYE